MAKTEVYSWRVSAETKTALEEAARRGRNTVGGLLERIVGEWLEQMRRSTTAEEKEQARLRGKATRLFGTIRGGNPFRAEVARQTVRARLARRRAH